LKKKKYEQITTALALLLVVSTMNDERMKKEEEKKNWGSLIAHARLSGRTSKEKNRLVPFSCVRYCWLYGRPHNA
jgi:hypothetical protein